MKTFLSLLVAGLLLGGCDTVSPEPGPLDYSGHWTGQLEAVFLAVIGENPVPYTETFDVELTLRQDSTRVTGSGSMSRARSSGDAARSTFRVDGGLDRICGPEGCTVRDSALVLDLQFVGPAPFVQLQLRLDLSPDGDALTGSACCAPGSRGGSAALRR